MEVYFILFYSVTLPNINFIHKQKPMKLNLSPLMEKPTICIGENKDADQLRGNREADQRLCFRYLDCIIPLLLKAEISSFQLFSVLVQAGLCRTCSETTLLVFLRGGSFDFINYFDTKSLSRKETLEEFH